MQPVRSAATTPPIFCVSAPEQLLLLSAAECRSSAGLEPSITESSFSLFSTPTLGNQYCLCEWPSLVYGYTVTDVLACTEEDVATPKTEPKLYSFVHMGSDNIYLIETNIVAGIQRKQLVP